MSDVKKAERAVESPPNYPIAILPEHVAQSPTMLIVKQYHSKKEFTVFRSDSSILYEVRGVSDNTRWREIIDPQTETALFELRRRLLNFKEMWYLRLPGEDDKEDNGKLGKVFTSAVVWNSWADVNITMRNMAATGSAKGEVTSLEVRTRSVRHITYDVFVDGTKILELRKIPAREAPGHDSGGCAWEVDIPAGVDLSLAVVIPLILAQIIPGDIPSRSGHA